MVATRIFTPEPAAASFRLGRAAASIARSARTVVLTSTYGDEPRKSVVEGAEVRRFPALRDRSGYIRGYVQYLSFDIPLFFRLLAQPSGTVVLCEPPPTTGLVTRAACAIRRFPYVYFAADLWSEAVVQAGMSRPVRAAVRWMERTAISGASAVLAVSPDIAERLPGLGARRISLVGNGIDTFRFRPFEEKYCPREEDDVGPLLVYAGTASEVHGARIFLDAMELILERHPRARMVFIGQGSEIPALEEAASSLPAGSVEFHPRLDPSQVARWLSRADMALASVRPGRYEFAFPTKAYAAASCGTPVLFTGGGPAARVVRDNRLGQSAEYSAGAIADALDHQLEDASWSATEARRWVEANASLSAVGSRVAKTVLGVGKRHFIHGDDEEGPNPPGRRAHGGFVPDGRGQ